MPQAKSRSLVWLLTMSVQLMDCIARSVIPVMYRRDCHRSRLNDSPTNTYPQFVLKVDRLKWLHYLNQTQLIGKFDFKKSLTFHVNHVDLSTSDYTCVNFEIFGKFCDLSDRSDKMTCAKLVTWQNDQRWLLLKSWLCHILHRGCMMHVKGLNKGWWSEPASYSCVVRVACSLMRASNLINFLDLESSQLMCDVALRFHDE